MVVRVGASGLCKQHHPVAELEEGGLGEDAFFHVDRGEEGRVGEQHLRATQEQVAVVVERVVKPAEDSTLRFRREVDERVAADQQVETGYGRILRQVVTAEGHRPPDGCSENATSSSLFAVS